MSTLVECTGLNKNYGKVTALHDVNLTIDLSFRSFIHKVLIL